MYFKSFTDELPKNNQRIVVIEGAVDMSTGIFTTYDEWTGENSLNYRQRILTDNNLEHWKWIGYDEFWQDVNRC
jgi:hypothetical protein